MPHSFALCKIISVLSYRLCSKSKMSRMRDITVLIYEEEATKICRWTLQYPNIETGGDLFGLWQSETEVVIQLAIGPGVKCRRTTTSFFQDAQYLGDVGTYLTSTEGLCNIGEWHSHHSLNLPEPSSGDRQTVWRHMPSYGLKRFLLLIATIKSGLANTHSFMFTSPENASRSGEMFPTKYQILPGPNPFRAQSEVQERLNTGAEMLHVRSGSGEFKPDNRNRIKQENKEREKMERKNRKRDKKEKKKNKKEMRKKERHEQAENETPKKCERKRKDGGGKRKRFWQRHSKKVDGKNHSELPDKKPGMDASSRTANDQENNQPRTESRKVDNWQNMDGGRSASEQDREQTRSHVASSGNTRSYKPLIEDQQRGNKESKPSSQYSQVTRL